MLRNVSKQTRPRLNTFTRHHLLTTHYTGRRPGRPQSAEKCDSFLQARAIQNVLAGKQLNVHTKHTVIYLNEALCGKRHDSPSQELRVRFPPDRHVDHVSLEASSINRRIDTLAVLGSARVHVYLEAGKPHVKTHCPPRRADLHLPGGRKGLKPLCLRIFLLLNFCSLGRARIGLAKSKLHI